MNLKKVVLMLLIVFFAQNLVLADNPFIFKNTSDPSARIFNGRLYLYTSSDMDIAGHYPMNETLCYSTDDLINWTDHGVVINENDFPWAKKDAYKLWAPDCIYKNGTYYLYVPVEDQNGVHRIGVATSSSPTGPFVPEPNYIQGLPAYAIDPGLFIDDDGTPYMTFSNGKVYIVQLKENMTEIAGAVKTISTNFSNKYCEGPWLYKHNNIYYLQYATDLTGKESIAYAMADSPMGPYTGKGVIMDPNPVEWTIHCSTVKYNNNWLFFYHNKRTPGYKRIVNAEFLNYNADGTIQKMVHTLEGISSTPVVPLPAGTYKIISQHSSKALEVAGASTINGGNVQQLTYQGTDNQHWDITPLGNGDYKIVNRNSWKSLDADSGGNIHQWSYWGADNQKWVLKKQSDGSYAIYAKSSNKVVDVSGVSVADGANIHQWEWLNAANQKWYIEVIPANAANYKEHFSVSEYVFFALLNDPVSKL